MALYSPTKALAKATGGTKKKETKNTTNGGSGSTYNPNTDYQAVINDAVARGDYQTAAKAEQERNAKIDAIGSSYAKTNNYSQYLNGGSPTVAPTNSPTTSYTPKGSYFDAGIPDYAASQIKYLQDLYATSKANGNMEAANKAHADAEAIRAQYGYLGGDDGSEFILLPQEKEQFQYEEPQPTYEKPYDPEIDRLLSQILNRDAFSYNVEEDPLFQQYKQMYMREGDRAMRETMAEAAAGAGGMNTYAMTAASQANNYYNSMLNDKIPELYNIAYDKYLKDIDMKINDLGLLQRMDETQYNRYRDTMNDWYNDKNFAYGVYRDDIGDSQWNKNFNYGVSRDNVADEQWNKTFDYNSDWDTKKWDYEASKYDKESAKEEVWKLIEMGIDVSKIDPKLLERAEMDATTVALAAASVQAENNTTGKTTTTTNGSTTTTTPKPATPPTPPTPKEDKEWQNGLTDLGLGSTYDSNLLVDLEEAGAIYEKDGKLYWAPGWNRQNYQQRMSNKVYSPFDNIYSRLNE